MDLYNAVHFKKPISKRLGIIILNFYDYDSDRQQANFSLYLPMQ
jgi:hypothetical protein